MLGEISFQSIRPFGGYNPPFENLNVAGVSGWIAGDYNALGLFVEVRKKKKSRYIYIYMERAL